MMLFIMPLKGAIYSHQAILRVNQINDDIEKIFTIYDNFYQVTIVPILFIATYVKQTYACWIIPLANCVSMLDVGLQLLLRINVYNY